MMARLPTPRFYKWYLVTVSQHCGKQMALYMVTILGFGPLYIVPSAVASTITEDELPR